MSEALRQVVWKCDRCGGDAQAIFGSFPSCKCGSTSFKAAQPPAPTAQHQQGCEALGGYGNGIGPCSCGAAQPVQQPGAEPAWWSLVMGAAASIEDAANCLRDPDAKKQADGAAKHYREAAKALWAQAAPAQRQPLPPGLRRAAEFTRADLGPDGSNYPHVRELLAFAEQALGITAAPEAQKG